MKYWKNCVQQGNEIRLNGRSAGILFSILSDLFGQYMKQTFLWGYLNVQVFTHIRPDINSLKNAIRQEIANVTQDTLRCVMASEPGRWQQCLDCHGEHLQDVVLKTWGFSCESKTLTYLNVFSCIYYCVQKMCYPTFKMGNVKCRNLYIDTITQLVSYYITSCNVNALDTGSLTLRAKVRKTFDGHVC